MIHSDRVPWQSQLSSQAREPLAAGRGILILSALLLVWLLSLIVRFAPPEGITAALVWWAGLTCWLLLQISVSRSHALERYAVFFPTLIQVAVPLVATGLANIFIPSFREAIAGIGSEISIVELTGIHILRLAAWGTIAKYRAQQLPRYFFLAGSVPDFIFAVSAAVLTLVLWTEIVTPSSFFLTFWSVLGIVVFFGAGVTMYFGVKNSLLGFRWTNVEKGTEPPTLLPFRWPMNLAPSFCVPVFILAHQLAIIRSIGLL